MCHYEGVIRTPHPRKMGEGQETQFPDTRARNRDGNDLKPPAESCRCVYSTRPQQSFLAHLPTRWSTEHEKNVLSVLKLMEQNILPPWASPAGWVSSRWAVRVLWGRCRGTGWGSGWSSARRPSRWRRPVWCSCSKAASDEMTETGLYLFILTSVVLPWLHP